ncbi:MULTISPECIES: hypothetical protein [Thermococcus]|uniref:Uncharacterized protein n=1 Tax=Thermococcus barossii TaxID=54077 RepID=A0A2Z2MIJ1_9EURY|nr:MULTISPECIES: hypothetical protein [Thermococcus]ASJ04545.1 hypothetical protein A3L01_03870 [Thermococcus barossii]NJE75895.1 hypothetical protein [Thermococcus sp. ES12]
MKRVLLILLLVAIVTTAGCVGNGGTDTGTNPSKTPGETETPESESGTVSPGTEEPTSTPSGAEDVISGEILNTTIAVNASFVPEKTFECLKDAPEVIASYYRAVKEEKDVKEFFDLDVVDADSLVELHNALYRAVDFKELKVENITCLVVSVNMVACRYGYSAVLVKDGTEKSLQRQYVTFLSGESCKIVWTEGEG